MLVTCFGWLSDLPSIADYNVEHKKVKPLIVKVYKSRKKDAIPAKADLRS